MNVFVTGSTGFVGRNFVEWLVQNQPDVSVTCLVRDVSKAQAQWPKQPRQLRWLQGDLLAPETFQSELLQAEQVFHAAALVSLRNGPEFYTMNTDATRNLVTPLADSNALKRLVFVGSISAVDRPLNETAVGPLTEASQPHPNTDYGKSKLLAEDCVREAGVPYSILRPAYIYGPYPRPNSSMDRLIRHVAEGKPYTRFPFPGRASEVYVEDLAEMIWTAGQHPGAENETFFVGNPEPVRVRDVFAQVAQGLGVPFSAMPLLEAAIERYRRFWYQAQPENLLLRILFEDFFYCSADKWYAQTGFKPRYGHQEGVAKTIHWYRQHGLLPDSPMALK